MFNEIVNIAIGIDDGLRDPSNCGPRLKLGLVLKDKWELRLVLSPFEYTLCCMIVGGWGWGKLRLREVLGSTKTSRKGRQGHQNQNNEIEGKVEKSFLFKKHPHCGQ